MPSTSQEEDKGGHNQPVFEEEFLGSNSWLEECTDIFWIPISDMPWSFHEFVLVCTWVSGCKCGRHCLTQDSLGTYKKQSMYSRWVPQYAHSTVRCCSKFTVPPISGLRAEPSIQRKVFVDSGISPVECLRQNSSCSKRRHL